MKTAKIASDKKGPKYNPLDPQHARVLKMRLPRNYEVIEGGYYIHDYSVPLRPDHGADVQRGN